MIRRPTAAPSQPKPPREHPMPDTCQTRQRPARSVPAPAAAVALLALALLGGCAADNPMRGALRDSVGPLFGGPSEAGFVALVDQNCGEKLVGGETVATLMERDTTFRQLTSRLYTGDISKDGFTNQLLQEYPAADANIPATGCIARALDTCLSTRCDGRPAASPDDIAAEQMVAEQDLGLEEVPAADRDAVDAMIEAADREAAGEVVPLPSEVPPAP
jgi:hypothetical protein